MTDPQPIQEAKKEVPVYAAVFLTPWSINKLLTVVRPRHPRVFAEHLTLGFGRHMEDAYPLGYPAMFTVTAVTEDERGQAVTGYLDPYTDAYRSRQQFPHITISCAEGIKPFYSNDLLKQNQPMVLVQPIQLLGIIDVFPRTRKFEGDVRIREVQSIATIVQDHVAKDGTTPR